MPPLWSAGFGIRVIAHAAPSWRFCADAAFRSLRDLQARVGPAFRSGDGGPGQARWTLGACASGYPVTAAAVEVALRKRAPRASAHTWAYASLSAGDEFEST